MMGEYVDVFTVLTMSLPFLAAHAPSNPTPTLAPMVPDDSTDLENRKREPGAEYVGSADVVPTIAATESGADGTDDISIQEVTAGAGDGTEDDREEHKTDNVEPTLMVEEPVPEIAVLSKVLDVERTVKKPRNLEAFLGIVTVGNNPITVFSSDEDPTVTSSLLQLYRLTFVSSHPPFSSAEDPSISSSLHPLYIQDEYANRVSMVLAGSPAEEARLTR